MVFVQLTRSPVAHSDPDICGGAPVFVGTRVPVTALFDYLEGGETLERFLDQFPSVSREQALAALDLGPAARLRKSPAAATKAAARRRHR